MDQPLGTVILVKLLLFEEPMPLLVALCLAGVILWIVARRRLPGRQRNPAVAGAVVWVLALIVWGMSVVIETNREQVITRCKQLVLATSPIDMGLLNDLFQPQSTLVGPNGSVWVINSKDLLARLQSMVRMYPIKSQQIVGLVGEMTGQNVAVTRLWLRTHMPATGYPKPPRTTWKVTWWLGNDGQWRIMTIQWLEFENRPAQQQLLM